MTEATWGGDTPNPAIDWRMSAALKNVPRGDEELPEVASLEGVVRAWCALDRAHQDEAVITPDHPILIEGVSHAAFTGQGIAQLVDQLPGNREGANDGE